jgi:hypothetical protein
VCVKFSKTVDAGDVGHGRRGAPRVPPRQIRDVRLDQPPWSTGACAATIAFAVPAAAAPSVGIFRV